MARYTVRVELHDAAGDDYDDLHAYMEQEGFLRYITDVNGKKYQLPTAEYNIETNKDRSTVLEKAKRAAANTGHKYMVLITESAGRSWHNLPTWKG